MKKKILVTGATGFVGSYVVQALINCGMYEVIATSKSLEKAVAQSWYEDVVYISYLIGKDDATNLYQYFLQPDIVVHLAWEDLGDYDNLLHIEKHLFSHYGFLKNLVQNGLQHLVVSGTCFEYGMQEGCLHESLCTAPVTTYGLAKDSLRKFLEELKKKYDFTFQWIRLFYMYGEGQAKKTLIAQLEDAIKRGDTEFKMSGGMQKRDYLAITQIALNIVKILSQTKVEGIINCGSGQACAIKDFVDAYAKSRGSNIGFTLGYYPYASYEPMEFYANIKKMDSIHEGSNE
ncbi:MAG: NAD-dependent epimerase/dehydratase family protein [Sulfurimonadaceae bacterium]